LNENAEAELLFGKGRSYGLEFLCKKEAGNLTGWISYTLSRTEKRFADINDGSWYPARQDRTHDIAIVANLKANKKLTLSATWVYYTGNAITFPSGKYEIDRNIVSYYTSRNGYRMPAYHRMDVGFNFHKQKKHGIRTWNVGFYNVYSRQNPFFLYFESTHELEYNQTGASRKLTQISLFPIIPSISYSYKF
jgi:hypothetical protein